MGKKSDAIVKSRLLGRLRRLSLRVCADLGYEGFSVEIALLSEREMQRLKHMLLPRAKKKEAEVLSVGYPKTFPLPDVKGSLLGEVYLNRDYARDSFGELGRLLIHGILHLSGYRHDRKRDIMHMEQEERRLRIRRLGRS